MKKIFAALLLSNLCLPVYVHAETPQEKGLAIAVEADKRDIGFSDYVADMKMILENKQGDRSVREINSKTLEMTGDGDKSLIVFHSPRDVKGTAFLNFTHKVGDDDQWLYLPALKRVKRISSSNKSGSFMGSEFAYEDISSQEVEKYTYTWLRDEPCPTEEFKDLTCFVMERVPVDENSGYTRQETWLDQQEYRVVKVDFYDRKASLLKTLINSGYKQYASQYWRPAEMKMVNHQNGKNTVLEWENYSFKTGTDDSDFNQNSLKRAR